MEKVIHPNTFIITASALDWSEEQFFEVLIEKYPKDLDFRKVRTVTEYLEFRNNLATRFLSNADIDILRKTSIALLNNNTLVSSNPTSPTQAIVTQPKVQSKRQSKNRRSRKNKSSKARLPPPATDYVARNLVKKPYYWPQPIEPPSKRPRIQIPFIPKTPVKPWVAHMPVCDFSNLGNEPDPCFSTQRTMIKDLTTIGYDKAIPGKFASRKINEAEYRHNIGIHRQEDGCDICDCAYRYHFFDDFIGVQTRIIALIALHHWVVHGANIRHFNWCPQTWMNSMYVDGKAVGISDIGPIIRQYIDENRVVEDNYIKTYCSEDKMTFTKVKGKDPDPAMCLRLTR
jgi:hypothetical protein